MFAENGPGSLLQGALFTAAKGVSFHVSIFPVCGSKVFTIIFRAIML